MKKIMRVWGHQDINSKIFKIHKGPVEKCKKCQKHYDLVKWNKLLKNSSSLAVGVA